ncbi:MAG TPA: hypothetical protein VKE51_11290 [Vicinamibacterales bacterium]|nr:hypothetical protein [Vicinamibacterales bacterium]
MKSREAIWVSRKRLGKDLDRDFALPPRVALAIHLAQAACAAGENDLLRPEPSASTETFAWERVGAQTLGVNIDKNVVSRLLAQHYRLARAVCSTEVELPIF